MRIIAGRHRGRRLTVPPGEATRPTADRVRQALFDMLWHAPYAGRAAIEDQRVLDAFAGTGALGLEALSRGAAHATFLDTGRPALAALRANIAACREEDRATILPADATKPPHAPAQPLAPCGLVFLDPPYAEGLLGRAVAALAGAGWIGPGALVVAESAAAMDPPALPEGFEPLAERLHGPARIGVFRAP